MISVVIPVFNEENNVENYFTGNQVCNSDQSASEGLDCGEVCNKYCSHIIKVPSQDTAVIQEAHMVITHYLCEKIERYL